MSNYMIESVRKGRNVAPGHSERSLHSMRPKRSDILVAGRNTIGGWFVVRVLLRTSVIDATRPPPMTRGVY